MRSFSTILLFLFASQSFAALNLYTDRETAVVQPIIDSFKQKTGIDVIVTELPFTTLKGTLETEGSTSPADVIFTKDLVYLTQLAQEGFFQSMPAAITAKVDASMHDPANLWTATTFRARTLVYEASLDVSGINTYEDLAKSDYAGTLCLRTSNSSYNQGLVASLVVNYGYDKAQEIVKGWVQNRAEKIFYKDDTSIVKAIATGTMTADGSQPACLLGITNSYYLAKYLQQEPNAPVKIKFLKQGTNGTHTNGTGAGIAAHSQQKKEAAQFIEFLLTKEMQIYLTNEHQDFPAAKGVKPENVAAAWMPFQFSTTTWTAVGDNLEEAKLIMIDTQYK